MFDLVYKFHARKIAITANQTTKLINFAPKCFCMHSANDCFSLIASAPLCTSGFSFVGLFSSGTLICTSHWSLQVLAPSYAIVIHLVQEID